MNNAGKVTLSVPLMESGLFIITILISVAAILSLISIIIVIFFERKNPQSSLSWIMVLVFLPYIGVIAYIVFGSGFRIRKRKQYRLKTITDELFSLFMSKRLDVGNTIEKAMHHPSAARAIMYLANDADGPCTTDNTVDVFTDGNEMYSRLLKDLRQAKDHIHLLFFIFREDRIGSEILSLLTEKAKAGIEVRLLYDSLGSFLSVGKKFTELRAAGGEVLEFAPIVPLITSSFRINYRNHRKIVVIDGAIGYVGGMNIGDEYRGGNPKLSPWRDTHLRLTGSSVWFLQERFIMDWSYANETEARDEVSAGRYFPAPTHKGNLGVQIASSGPDTKKSAIKNGFLSILYSATDYVYIQSPYFAPSESLLDALHVAARAGVDVRLMVSRLHDHLSVHLSTYGYIRQIMDYGVRIFQYDGFIHSKTIVSDDLAVSVGSMNLTNRSFTQDFEINAFIFDKKFNKKNREIFLADQQKCIELTPDWFAKQGKIFKVACNVARLLAPLI